MALWMCSANSPASGLLLLELQHLCPCLLCPLVLVQGQLLAGPQQYQDVQRSPLLTAVGPTAIERLLRGTDQQRFFFSPAPLRGREQGDSCNPSCELAAPNVTLLKPGVTKCKRQERAVIVSSYFSALTNYISPTLPPSPFLAS